MATLARLISAGTLQAWAFEGCRNGDAPRAPFPGCDIEDFLYQESRPQVSLARVLVLSDWSAPTSTA
jgi:hypothetical protein